MRERLRVFLALAAVSLIASQDFLVGARHGSRALSGWWADASFHVVTIDAIAAALRGGERWDFAGHGLESGFYHFLSYVPAAVATAAFGLAPIASYAYVYAPLSMFLFAAGLWLIQAECWPRERALWATVVFMLLPEAIAGLGALHDYLLLKWLVSVSPGLGYGVFASALAWTLCLRGIRQRRLALVALGWIVCALLILIKAHLFVANALPLGLYTIARYPALRARHRWALAAAFGAAYGLATWAAGAVPAIPLIRLDFAIARDYAATLARIEPLAAPVRWALGTCAALPAALAPVALAVVLLVVHLGLFIVPFAVQLRFDARAGQLARWLPTLAILATYLLHAVGLAHDLRAYTHQGQPFELNHRPFVWAVALVEVATLASLADRARAFLTPGRRWLLAALLAPVAIFFYRGIQFAPRWSPPRIDHPAAYFDALDDLRRSARPGEIVQATDLDPHLVAQAVTGHPAYVAGSAFRMRAPEPVASRAREVEAWLDEPDAARVEAFAREHGIVWVVETDRRSARWPEEIAARHRVRQDGGVAVYRFAP